MTEPAVDIARIIIGPLVAVTVITTVLAIWEHFKMKKRQRKLEDFP